MRRTSLVVVCIVVMAVAGIATPVAGSGAVHAESQAPECTYPLTITDGTGEEVTIEEPPDEIVVLHASSAQVVHDIGLWDNVTGAPVEPFTAYLEDHDAPEDVTDDEGWPQLERIVDLEPDLVLVGHVGNPDDIEFLRGENLTVYQAPMPTSVDDIRNKVLSYGALTGACDGAADRVDWMDERLDAIDETVESTDERPLAYYELGDGWTTGEGTFQHDSIVRSGADNLGAEAGVTAWAEISEEVIIDQNPDFVIYGDVMDAPPVTDAVQDIPAIEQDRTIAVDSNLINQAGPRIVLVMETLAEEFAAGPIEEATADGDDAVADDTAAADDADDEPAPADDDDGATITASDDEDDTAHPLPGMGAIAAIVAILGGAFYRRR